MQNILVEAAKQKEGICVFPPLYSAAAATTAAAGHHKTRGEEANTA